MNKIKYLIQFILILILFLIFKILGLKYSQILSKTIFKFVGPYFRNNQTSHDNLKKALVNSNKNERAEIIKNMWSNYGKIFAEYLFIKDFRNNPKYSERIHIENKDGLEKIRKNSKPVIFVSGHFSNFELMAMSIEKSGINLAALYRPLNNIFLNPIMENIRVKYICKKQIKKGISGTRELLQNFKNGYSIALMIDQRVSEGERCDFFNEKALTTTIPAQLIKKFNIAVVPIYIERIEGINFRIKVNNPINFSQEASIQNITDELNQILEKMIYKNPNQWIWSHNRWK